MFDETILRRFRSAFWNELGDDNYSSPVTVGASPSWVCNVIRVAYGESATLDERERAVWMTVTLC